MKTHLLLVPCVATMLAIGGAPAAEKQKSATVSGYPFWTAPKRGPVTEFVPGLDAVLNLTEAQKAQIAAAYAEMMDDATVKAARGLSKNDPSVTTEQREAARAAIDAATARMRSKVDAVLTVEQKAMIENINGAYAAATQEVGATYQVKVASTKIVGEERMRMQQQQRDEVDALFRLKLGEMLTTEQIIAMEAAASKVAQKKPGLK
jgi:hypothetical protein